MRFWDASALVPLLVQQPATESVNSVRSSDPELLVWWGTPVECASAISRLKRIGLLDDPGAAKAQVTLEQLAGSWTEVEPAGAIRSSARELLKKHELTSGDAFQLAAALQGLAGDKLREFVCLDRRLRRGALNEGFTVLPRVEADALMREPRASSYEIAAQLGIIGSDKSRTAAIAANAKYLVRRAIPARVRRRSGRPLRGSK